MVVLKMEHGGLHHDCSVRVTPLAEPERRRAAVVGLAAPGEGRAGAAGELLDHGAEIGRVRVEQRRRGAAGGPGPPPDGLRHPALRRQVTSATVGVRRSGSRGRRGGGGGGGGVVGGMGG